LVSSLVEWIAARGLGIPAVLFLEAHKPLAAVGGQALLFLQPLVGFVGPMLGWSHDESLLADYAALLEDPENVDRILDHLANRTVAERRTDEPSA